MKSVFFVLAVALCVLAASATPLDDYVRKPDPSYKWETFNSFRGANFTVWNIKLTSQTWMHPSVVDVYLWTHWLSICIPDEVR
jgi:PhoPQ-activated pathogenicity-related protein